MIILGLAAARSSVFHCIIGLYGLSKLDLGCPVVRRRVDHVLAHNKMESWACFRTFTFIGVVIIERPERAHPLHGWPPGQFGFCHGKVCQSVCLSVCHTRESCLNGSSH